MERRLIQNQVSHFLFRVILFATILSLVFLCNYGIQKHAHSWVSVESRIERLQERTAIELRRYYEGGGNWTRCYHLLQRLERLQQRNK